MEALLIIVGIVLLIIHICMIVAFFGMSKDLRALKNLYVDGTKEDQDSLRFYKLPVVEDEEKTKKIEEERKKQQEKIKNDNILKIINKKEQD